MAKEDFSLTGLARKRVLEKNRLLNDVDGNFGLDIGHLEWRLDNSSEDFYFRSVRRSICDVGAFISISGENVDIGLTHYYPYGVFRKAHTYVINALRQKRHRDGIRFATMATSHSYRDKSRYPEDKEERYFWKRMVKAAKRYNNNRKPDVIAVDPDKLQRENTSSDIIISRRRLENDFEISIEVTNSPYKKTFRQSEAQKVSRRRPIKLRLE
ncbi:MAG TPA: hypothetical protein VF189_05890 [Patescibacteria group bacterium]